MICLAEDEGFSKSVLAASGKKATSMTGAMTARRCDYKELRRVR